MIPANRWMRASLAGLLLVAAGGAVRAVPGWWQDRLVSKGRGYLAAGDLRGAFLSAHEALNRNAAFVPAIELMADLEQRSRSPEEIFWRQRLVILQPADPARPVQLAEAALARGELFIAQDALAAVPQKGHSFRYCQTAAGVALAQGDLRAALDQLLAATRLNPDDVSAKLMLERVRLASPEPAARALAHDRLESFRSDFKLRLEAARLLLAEARAQGRIDDARTLATSICDLPEAQLSDRIACLEELDRPTEQARGEDLRSLRFENALGRLKNEAGFDAASIYALGAWLNAHHHADLTRQWTATLQPAQRSLPAAQLVTAEASAMLGDWPELDQLLTRNWGPLEPLRFAYLARARLARSGARDSQFGEYWQKAVQAAGSDRDKLTTLATETENWGWIDEPDALWWTLANEPAGSLAPLQHLYAVCRKRGATVELLRVSERICRLAPGNVTARNNVAQLSMLLGRGTPEIDRLAQENDARRPDDWAVNSTYAFSLHLQGRDREAIGHLLGLPGEPQRDPQMAAYFGVFYAAAGQPEMAQPLLQLAARAELLPEEARLVQAALKTP